MENTQAPNYKRDTRRAHSPEPGGRDNCQTPPYAILPLLPYLQPDWLIWEPAAGEGYLVAALKSHRLDVIASSLDTGQDFFHYESAAWDVIITNPPYSLARPWLERCYQLGRPFALLMKTEIIANQGIQKLCAAYGDLEHIFPESRINYKMPNKGWVGSGAQFNTHWYTYGLNIGRPFTYLSPINNEKRLFHSAPLDLPNLHSSQSHVPTSQPALFAR